MMRVLLVLALALAARAPASPLVQEIAPGVHLLAGGFDPGRGPDGNTVIFDAPDGLIVVDTGRHAWHSDAILAYAAARERRIAAIVNTHWHLDHSSGNGRLRAAFPAAPVFATRAVERAISAGGFLDRQVAGAEAMLADEALTDVQREEVQIYLATMAERDVLRPSVTISESRRMRIAGRRFDVRVTAGAVTDADLWIYDRRSRVAVVGDLVTLPAPFFETACPQAWRAALDEVWRTPFRVAIPGHGAPMSRAEFGIWRDAFGAFVDCAAGDADAQLCADAWTGAIAPFIDGDDLAARRAPEMAAYYVVFLRDNGGKSPDCLTR